MTNAQTGRRDLVGRRAVVSGGGSGMGRATALRLAEDGAAVAVLDLREGSAKEVADTITAAGGRALAFGVDVGEEHAVEAAISAAAAELGGLDTVVTAAGIVAAAPTHELDLEVWERVLRINLTGTFLVVKHALRHLLEHGSGSIVTVGSIAATVVSNWSTSYDASKGGVLQFTKGLANEYAAAGIRANCVCPGAVATGLLANSAEVVGAPPSPPQKRLQVPIDRPAEPEEIANVIRFLCSDEASFMTGSAVYVDGGWTAV